MFFVGIYRAYGNSLHCVIEGVKPRFVASHPYSDVSKVFLHNENRAALFECMVSTETFDTLHEAVQSEDARIEKSARLKINSFFSITAASLANASMPAGYRRAGTLTIYL